ncbi:MAG: alpha/beta hydrolase domain-containing protein, partial [Halieaceae bacterium]|nr:alpha/beta hydrolase domain-containing protein [Halieaceae bacterium]
MFTCFSNRKGVICILLASAILVACSGDNNNKPKVTEPEFLPIANPTVSLPPDVGAISLLAENFDLGEVGYRQSEFFLEGTATAYTNLSELGDDGEWSVEPGEEAQYKTRIVVKRPIDPADFSGDV